MAEAIFPDSITEWRCPACGMRMVRKSYNLDAERKKCSKTWHKAAPVSQKYVKETPDAKG